MKKMDFNMLPVPMIDGDYHLPMILEQPLRLALTKSPTIKLDYGRIQAKLIDEQVILTAVDRKITKKEQDDTIWKVKRFATGRMAKSAQFVKGLRVISKLAKHNPDAIKNTKEQEKKKLDLMEVYLEITKVMSDGDFYEYQDKTRPTK